MSRTLLLLVLVLQMLPLRAAENSRSSEHELWFALAIAQGVKSYQEPGRFNAAESFELPILTPHRILEERQIDGRKWYQLQRPSESGTGWVDGRAVEIWNSRHALRPLGIDDSVIPGYCSAEAVTEAVKGNSQPCMRFDGELLKKQENRAPFPVVSVHQWTPEFGSPQTYMEVLAPTLYSNIAPMKHERGPAVSQVANTLEVIILIDATGSMDEEIRRATGAMSQLVKRTSAANVHARFLVLAYRDTDFMSGAREKCLPMESSSGKTLTFGAAADAERFLKKLRSCGGGDDREALWDAFYLLKGVKVTPGAARLLLVLGDEPALEKTRGGDWFGVHVPSGLSRGEVFKEIDRTIGHSTAFFGFVVRADGGMRRTAEEVVSGFQFTRQRISIVGKSGILGGNELQKDLTEGIRDMAGLGTSISESVESAMQNTGKVARSVESCRKLLAQSEHGAQVELFCGDSGLASDAELAGRVRDILTNPAMDAIVVRRLWLPVRQDLDNVALITQREAREVVAAFQELSERTRSGRGCKAVGKEVWYTVMSRILPAERRATSSGSVFDQPAVDKPLHEYWKLHAGQGRSVIQMSPYQLASLSTSSCKALSERLGTVANELKKMQARYVTSQYLWIPFSLLP